MVRIVITFILISLTLHFVYAQKSGLKGTIIDANTRETLVGVNVIIDSISGVSSDIRGNYSLDLDPGRYEVIFKYVGYHTEQRTITINFGDVRTLNIELSQMPIELDMAVVTAGKFEQRLSDVTVSMEIIKPAFIENTNTTNIESAVKQMPGCDVLDGQASIRGGSGYNYGAGSRVLVLVDDLPILTADVGEVKWNFLPVENIEQVEILKGASSALYGSSALNGIINVRTSYPDNEPQTKFTLFSGIYLKPSRKELAWWWDTNPLFSGFSFSDSRKLNNIDIVSGANVFSNAGYREDNFEERARLNFAFRHRPEKTEGFSYGFNTNIQWQYTSDFFIWQDADSGAFLQKPEVITPTKGFRFNIDPWASFYDNRQNRHSLRTRFYKVQNRFEENPDKNNGSDLYYGEYRFHKVFKNNLNWTLGMMGLYGVTNAELYGDHYNSNIAIFTQFDYKFFSRLSASVGLRWERYTLDNTDEESSPVVRAGLNYQVAGYTFIRASYGQGYRFPSIAEKYTATSLGSVNIFPNPDLKPETGWTSELGIKQGIKISEWNGYVDIAAYWTEYTDMMEFTFGVWPADPSQEPTLDDIGFKSLNVGNSRITGIDLNLTGTGTLAGIPLTLFAGYTYMNPVDLSNDILENNILKYRYKHSVKGDAAFDFNKISTGISFIYNSFMERIDEAFEEPILGQEIFPGLKDYRIENNKGFVAVDFRVSYQFTASAKLALIVKNIFNKEYMGRPGDIQPPRNVTLQFVVKF
ncbi:MAG: TonB-dependent receptor [Bacteroidales bacterium]|nr:TonB-dependent receptor [Bacteroidales bacterium]